MKHFAKASLVSAALCVATVFPAHAELDVARLKAAIETSFEADYPKLDALYKELHAEPELAFAGGEDRRKTCRRNARAGF